MPAGSRRYKMAAQNLPRGGPDCGKRAQHAVPLQKKRRDAL